MGSLPGCGDNCKGREWQDFGSDSDDRPTSDEMNCAKCHGSNAFDDILAKHDSEHETNFSASGSQPGTMRSCHPDPALGINTGPEKYLSQVMHGSHASDRNRCYDCHPGATTKCSRSIAHTSANGNCTECHGIWQM